MRRVNLWLNQAQYYAGRVFTVESSARLLASATVSFPGIPVEMTKRDIASAIRLLRVHPALSLVMFTGLHLEHFEAEFDISLFYLAIPFGRDGPPANCAISGDAISAIQSHRGMERPGRSSQFPSLSELYVDDGLFSDLKNRRRQTLNTTAWEPTTRGVVGRKAINADKLAGGGIWGSTHTMMGFAIDSESLPIRPTAAKIAGARALFDQLREQPYCRSLDVNTIQQFRNTSNISAPRTLCGVCYPGQSTP